MNKIEAEYVPGSDDDGCSGMGEVICPACGKRVHEQDMCTTHEENRDRTIEVCDDCLMEAERETGETFDSDVLSHAKFQKLWDHILPITEERKTSEAPQHVTMLADLLGGTVWNSGGGMFLVLRHRADGHVVALSDECVSEFASMDELAGGSAINSIRFT